MLKLATKENLSEILQFCNGDLLGTRIGCYCLAYGFNYDFLNIWFDDSEGKIETVIAKFYDALTIVTTSEDIQEVSNFVKMIGFETLECNLDICEKLNLRPVDIKKSYIFSGTSENLGAITLGEEYYKALYKLVSKNIPRSFKDTKNKIKLMGFYL